MQTPTGGFAPGYFLAAPAGAPPEQFRDRNYLYTNGRTTKDTKIIFP